jgi:uncharacterized RDD family membrane protein YckC/RNA polymerase subunit RPABC4/transcription elongation factor Spt4
MTCRRCGETLPAGQAYCPFCGSFEVEGPPTNGAIQPRPSPPHTPSSSAVQQCWGCNTAFPMDETTCPTCGLVMKKPGSGPAMPEVASLQRLTISYAGCTRRAAAHILDMLVILFAFYGLGFVIGLLSPFLGGDAPADGPTWHTVTYGLTIVCTWLYFAIFESSPRQATPGKVILGMRVTDEDGEGLTFFFATVRFFAKFLPGPLLVGYLMALVTERRQAFHDKVVDSVVVRV